MMGNLAHSGLGSITRHFSFFANELYARFPDLDLRFNLEVSTRRVRFMVPGDSNKIFELYFHPDEIQQLLTEATFTIKQATGRFDA